MYVVAVHKPVSVKVSSIPDNVRVPLLSLDAGDTKKIWVPLKGFELTSIFSIESNYWVVKFVSPPTRTNVSLSLDLSNPSIITS